MDFFTGLLDAIFPPKPKELLVRTATLESLSTLVTPRIIEFTQPPTTSLFPFRDPLVRALISEAKFTENSKALSLLSTVLHDYISELVTDAHAYTKTGFVLIPIPLHASRKKERGYNQAEKLLDTHIPGTRLQPDLLTRFKETKPQTSLGRIARLKNMEQAFKATQKLEPEHTYIVFDDVITTGATMEAAIEAIRMAGAMTIIPLTLAH